MSSPAESAGGGSGSTGTTNTGATNTNTGGAAVSTGAAPTNTTGGFDASSWDGKRDSLPEGQRGVFDAMTKRQEDAKASANGAQLKEYLRQQIYNQQQQQPVQQQPSQRQSEEDSPLTREAAMEMFRKEQAQRQQQEMVEKFRSSLLEVVAAPQIYGENGATIAFASESDVDGFKKYVSETLNGGLSAKDLLLLYKKDDIFRQLGESAVKGFERKLASNKPSNATGGGVETRASTNPNPDATRSRRPGRAPSTAELLQANNPDLYSQILNGKTDIF